MAQDGSTLSEAFARAQQLYEAVSDGTRRGDDPGLQEQLVQLVDLLKAARVMVREEGTFSRNEELDDVNSQDLKYLLVDFFLASAVQRLPRQGRERLGLLGMASATLTAFLSRCDDLGLVHENDRAALEGEPGARMTQEATRATKIDRFKRDRSAQERVAELAALAAEAQRSGRELDEDLERERTLLTLASCTRQAVDDLYAIEQEKELLQMMLAREEAVQEGRAEPEEPPQPPGSGLEVTHIDSQLNLTREVVTGTVFQPDHHLPTMSLAEYGEQQRQLAEEAQAREQQGPSAESLARRRAEHLYRDGDEDDEKAADQAALNDREWDAWKEANPAGAGNKKVNRG